MMDGEATLNGVPELHVPRWILAAAAAWIVLVAAPIWALDAARYSAWTSALQASGVMLALLLGLATLLADSKSRRVDRVYALHQELTNGDLDEARRRLGESLRKRTDSGVVWKRMSREQLRVTKVGHKYPPDTGYDPLVDSGRPVASRQ
jgi:hypothetical protein